MCGLCTPCGVHTCTCVYLMSQDSPAENVINWDIKRTYMGHGYFQEDSNKEALYKISKAYSVYDEQVGYCQGFSFMAAVLLLQVRTERERERE